jgi:Ca2+-binding EF-hand superfamily protein
MKKTLLAALVAGLTACGLAVNTPAAEPGSDDDIASAKPAANAKDAGAAKPIVKIAEAKPRAAVAAKPPVPPTDDIQDLVFRSSDGLQRMRLHIQVNGKPAAQAWNSFIDKVFAFYDRNDDKFLSPQEVARMPNPAILSQGFNLIFNGRGQRGNPNFAQMDTNKDGKVSLEEFREFALKNGFGPVQVQILPPQPTAQQLTDAFYKHVNSKGDGKLTKADLAAAWTKLAPLDTDEDEVISTQELLARPSNPFYAEAVQAEYAMGSRPQQQSSPFIALPRDWTPDSAADAVLAALEREKVTLLPHTSMRFEASLPQFVRDTMRNAERDYIKGILTRPTDLELSVQLGSISEGLGRVMSLGAQPAGVKPYRPAGKATGLEKLTKLGADGILRLTMSDALVEFGRTDSNNNRFDGTANYYIQQFKEAAGEKKYLTKQELMEHPQLQFFANVFDDLDRNGDGKLTVQELQAGFDLLTAAPNSQIYVTVVDQGRGLVDLIDANHDGRITRRELLNAVKNFATFDKNGDGVIERSELPSQYRVTASQGPSNGRFGVQFVGFGRMNQQLPAPNRGPMWFRKMDRNADGDVSEREFLGTPEEFKAIDADGDGLISPEEAERYDAARKKQQQAAKK